MENGVPKPPGTFVQTDGSRFHLRVFGPATGPTVLFETGLTMMSSCWAWLAPELAATHRVLTYDRAGLGWSDDRAGLRDAAQIAAELKLLLRAAQIHPPFVLLGHSMGAIIHRVFLQENARDVLGLVWLDAAHPDQTRRRETRRRMRNFFLFLEAANLLAARNLPRLEFPLLSQSKGLPEEDFKTARYFFRHPRHLRTTAREARAWELSAQRAREVPLHEMPLLMITAQKRHLPGWEEMQDELARLSSKAQKVTFTEASHISLLCNQEHARRAAGEIRTFVDALS